MKRDRFPRPGRRLRPREFFRLAERWAIRIRKLLCALKVQQKAVAASGLMDDADRLVELIERLARRGQWISAADAIDLAEQVDHLVDLLAVEVDALLTF